ncbi:hypothetical protein [Acetobacter sp.]|uniref:hypothetical protein n=1 Tax=Acetobacter sp. TaxID=440 RepID=UPI0025C11C9B|nr:hypothetical protein [Acetobacter sp.]MCH4091110.1 hypothetical protein [Acetobacter sp.]MCI1300293.1 hypothetical protein [Acetobacter sp.]MCI1316039.1 hypothetical protein [Acetobacter sp.]
MKVFPFQSAVGRSFFRIVLPFSCALLAGCQHRDLVDTTVDWYHQHEGGVIAQQRPPAPGQLDPYPRVGLTPTTPPSLPSPELRQSITNNLIASRNLTMRTTAQNGTLTPVIPPPPNAASSNKPAAPASDASKAATTQASAATSAPLPAGGMGAILDAADSSSTGPAAAHASPAPKAQKTTPEAELAMPEFRGDAAVVATSVTQPLPDIPAGPPGAPAIPGFVAPRDATTIEPIRPDYDVAPKDGTLIGFLPGSDQMKPGQDGALNKLITSRHGGQLFLHCSGETVSLSPQDQTQAVELGLLRGRTLADALIKKGVPASALHISSSAFGPAARVSTQG